MADGRPTPEQSPAPNTRSAGDAPPSLAAPNLVITGMMGTGKSDTGRVLAGRLGWAFVDVDERVAAEAGRSISEIFALEGEEGFREREHRTVADLEGVREHVIATGGWTVGDPDSRQRLAELGAIVCLAARPETLARRLESGPRPPLARSGPADIAALFAHRRSVYDAFPWQVRTDERDPEEVAEIALELLAAVEGLDARAVAGAGPPTTPYRDGGAGPLTTPGTAGRVLIAEGLLEAVGAVLRSEMPMGRLLLVADERVDALHGDALASSLADAGFAFDRIGVPSGEAAKRLPVVAGLYDALVAGGLERTDGVVTLGGGATSDAAGFAAATYLRGVPHVPVPSSLLAMVDAAIGGKTGVNLDAGKNLVGAFHFPALVLVDSGLLATLPGPELVAGLAEVLKAGLIGDPELVSLLDRQGGAIAAGDADWPELIARSVSVKAQIVAEDPWELGRREHLNLGHTFAHALEAASDYALAHGPAVGIGLLAAARLGRDLGLTEDHLPERVERILRRLGLPVGYPGPSPVRVLAAMGVDKKRRGGRLRFVLPKAVGDVTVVDDVPESAVLGILDTILRPQQP